MAGDWIKFEKATLDKPEVFEIAGMLDIDPDAVIGKLMRVWNWFDDQSHDGCAPVALRAQLNRITGVTGFVEAMQHVGWMSCEDSKLTIPNFDRHNGQTSKQRALSAKRMAKTRTKRCGASATSSATKAQPEKRREEKSSNNPLPPKGDFGLDDSASPRRKSKRVTDAKKKIMKIDTNTPTMIRIGDLFGRKENTLWTIAEAEALAMIQPDEAQIEGMENYYLADHGDKDIRRRDLITLLNNWQSELDRAREWWKKSA